MRTLCLCTCTCNDDYVAYPTIPKKERCRSASRCISYIGEVGTHPHTHTHTHTHADADADADALADALALAHVYVYAHALGEGKGGGEAREARETYPNADMIMPMTNGGIGPFLSNNKPATIAI